MATLWEIDDRYIVGHPVFYRRMGGVMNDSEAEYHRGVAGLDPLYFE